MAMRGFPEENLLQIVSGKKIIRHKKVQPRLCEGPPVSGAGGGFIDTRGVNGRGRGGGRVIQSSQQVDADGGGLSADFIILYPTQTPWRARERVKTAAGRGIGLGELRGCNNGA